MKTLIKIFVLLWSAFLVFGGGFILNSYAPPKKVQLTIPLHVTPAYIDLYSGAEQFANRINQEGKGQVEVKLYHSETLYKVKDIVPSLMNGSCEIVFHTSTLIHWLFPTLKSSG